MYISTVKLVDEMNRFSAKQKTALSDGWDVEVRQEQLSRFLEIQPSRRRVGSRHRECKGKSDSESEYLPCNFCRPHGIGTPGMGTRSMKRSSIFSAQEVKRDCVSVHFVLAKLLCNFG